MGLLEGIDKLLGFSQFVASLWCCRWSVLRLAVLFASCMCRTMVSSMKTSQQKKQNTNKAPESFGDFGPVSDGSIDHSQV